MSDALSVGGAPPSSAPEPWRDVDAEVLIISTAASQAVPPAATSEELPPDLSPADGEEFSAAAAAALLTQLRGLVSAQQKELASQHLEVSQLRRALSEVEGERNQLSARVQQLSRERDDYLQASTAASERAVAIKKSAAEAESRREVERRDDNALYQSNVARLLEEKASLLEEVEFAQRQKDELTEALVTAHRGQAHAGRLQEELATWKAQHSLGAETLQARTAM